MSSVTQAVEQALGTSPVDPRQSGIQVVHSAFIKKTIMFKFGLLEQEEGWGVEVQWVWL